MPRLDIEPDINARAYRWGATVEMDRGWLRIAQEQGNPNGLQVVLFTPKQARELITEYIARYGEP